jgi:hypothetical protein
VSCSPPQPLADRSSRWKAIGGGTLAAVALSIVGGSVLDEHPKLPDTGHIVFAICIFISVVVLHWLLWLYIVPGRPAASEVVRAIVERRPQSGFFKGVFGTGYAAVALYCAHYSGFLPPFERGILAFGLLFIGLGMAARLREIFLALTTPVEPSVAIDQKTTG